MEEIILTQQLLGILPGNEGTEQQGTGAGRDEVDTFGGTEAHEDTVESVGLLGSLFWSWQVDVFNDVSEGEAAKDTN